MKIDSAYVQADVIRAADQWRRNGMRLSATALPVDKAVDIALGVVSGMSRPPPAVGARFCIATKGPHLRNSLSLGCVAARLLAFGIDIHGLTRIDGDAERVARSLYPRAARYFTDGPTAPAHWKLLARRFGTTIFEDIFGRSYHPSMVVPAAEVIRANDMSPGELTALWETGRAPVGRAELTDRYGARAAGVVLGDSNSYEWFRGPLPIGISRVAPAMTAFAMRHERLYGGAPVIVLNGHVPGLTELFAPQAYVFDVALTGGGPDIADVRRLVAGNDGQPGDCLPGSIRGDASAGNFPLGSADPLDSRFNMLHCSDGLLAGLLEVQALVSARASAPDLLQRQLRESGLTDDEITHLVLRDPEIRSPDESGRLSDRTAGLPLTACVREILRVVPAVFGAVNGYADGVGFRTVDRVLQRVVERDPPTGDRVPDRAEGALSETVPQRSSYEAAGRTAIQRGLVGVLIPAGGTGGRFGGYDLPESHPARQKVLARVLRLAGRTVSAMDVRLANIRFWNAGASDRVAAAVMSSPTSEVALRHWRDSLDEPYRKTLRIFGQHGIYRIEAGAARHWTDLILRAADGTPSLKPSGSLGLLSGFVLSGMFDLWHERGIEYLAVANGDDVGFRLDPRAIGHLAQACEVDGIVVGVPWGYTAEPGLRGDRSGWCIDASGTPWHDAVPETDRRYDTGGALCLVPDGARRRLAIAESAEPGPELFSTNQFYLRLSSIRRVLEHAAGSTDRLAAMQAISNETAASIEAKSVLIDGVSRQARQISQPFHGLLRWMRRFDVHSTSRHAGPDTRSSYATLKQPEDIGFAQLIVDALQRHHGETAAP
ncbi:MAG: hypothetical protein ABW022_19870 [Actinoplanes sp.]